ncbi:hypothetical protein DFH05DRAFT_208139 [Lentinula detonsa]|uniref:PH domain-containing protein n=1 Tax=Lentinula detonsa TaxID=2804962 RepID=A0A9W8NWQ7_9AGAR|nr:hypothetical protein DFH05DRAFT_208139 [Lentinula detonsa]
MEVQEPYPRAQSAMQMRSSSFHSKANSIFNKVSILKVRLLGNTRSKNNDNHERGKGPYMSMNVAATSTRETRSMDINMHVAQKPYMSQPVLNIRSMLDPEDHDGGDSTGSSSQSMHHPSPPRTNFVNPTVSQQQQHGAVEGLPHVNEASQTTSSNSALLSSIKDAKMNRTYQARLEGFPESSPFNPSRQVQAHGQNEKVPSSLHTDSFQQDQVLDSSSYERPRRDPERPNMSQSTLSISSSTTVTPQNTHSSENSLGPIPPPKPELSKNSHSPQTISSSPSPSASSTSTPTFTSPLNSQYQLNPNASPSSQRLTTLHNPPPTTLPPAFSSYPSRQPSAPHLNTAILTTPSSRRPFAPHLNTPLPGRRFSLVTSDNESASARLSPSIIIRQPALPILNLPKLKLPQTTDESDGHFGSPLTRNSASEGTGLAGSSTSPRRASGMVIGSIGSPVVESKRFSVHAQSRRNLREMPALPMAGNDHHEDDDDHDDIDGDGESSDEDEDTDVEGEGDCEDEDTRSSLESSSRLSPLQPPMSSVLPSVDVSRIDLSFLNIDPKGKQRANDDSGKTPTASSRTPRFGLGNDYFSAQHYSSPPSSGGENSNPTPPGSTPRIHLGDTLSFLGKTPVPVPARTPISTETPVFRTPLIPLPERPGIYKHASRSMIDIPGLGLGQAATSTEAKKHKDIRNDQVVAHGTADSISSHSMTPDGVLDHVSGIKRRSFETHIDDVRHTAKTLTIASNAHDHSSLDNVASKPLKPTRVGPSDEETRRALSSRKDALLITEEPRDPHARKDTQALVAPPHLSMEEHLAHIQSPAPAPRPSVPSATGKPAPSASGRPSSTGSLLRRRSMPTFIVGSPPPPYPSFVLEYTHGQPLATDSLGPPRVGHISPSPSPHPEEGNERLPPYSNEIFLRAIMPRKLEFIGPGVQAKDRKWRKVVCELEGTVFRVYRCPPEYTGTGKVTDWWERKVGVGDMSVGVGVGGNSGSSTTAGHGGTATISGTVGSASVEEKAREQERLRQEKIDGEGGGRSLVTQIALPPPASANSEVTTNNAHSPQSRNRSLSRSASRSASRSRTNLNDGDESSPQHRVSSSMCLINLVVGPLLRDHRSIFRGLRRGLRSVTRKVV